MAKDRTDQATKSRGSKEIRITREGAREGDAYRIISSEEVQAHLKDIKDIATTMTSKREK